MAAATVKWTRAEIDEVLAALSASSMVRGRKKALEELNRARAKTAAKDDPKARGQEAAGDPGGRLAI